jgi:hypothetical protein
MVEIKIKVSRCADCPFCKSNIHGYKCTIRNDPTWGITIPEVDKIAPFCRFKKRGK